MPGLRVVHVNRSVGWIQMGGVVLFALWILSRLVSEVDVKQGSTSDDELGDSDLDLSSL